MAPENDLNKDQSVTGSDLNSADVVNQPDLNKDAGSVDQQNLDVLADGTPTDKTVKYADLKKAVDDKNVAVTAQKAAEEQTLHAQRQLELMAQQQQPTATPTAPALIEDQALKDLGITADELYGENVVLYQKRVNQLSQAQQQQNQAQFANQQFMMSHPELNQVVGNVNPANGQITTASPELYAILGKKPYLANSCGTLQGAYEIVMQERKITKLENAGDPNKNNKPADKVATATDPLGGSAGGGSGGGEMSPQGLLSRDQVAQIDADFASGKYR